MAATPPSTSEWQQAIDDVGLTRVFNMDPGAITWREFSQMFSPPLSRGTAERHLMKMVDAGTALRVRQRRLDPQGRLVSMHAYTLLKKAGSKKGAGKK